MSKRRYFVGVDNGINGAWFSLDSESQDNCNMSVVESRRKLTDDGNIIDYSATMSHFKKTLLDAGFLYPKDGPDAHLIANRALFMLETPLMNKTGGGGKGGTGGKTSKATIASTVGSFTLWQTFMFELLEEFAIDVEFVGPQKWQNTYWAPRRAKREFPDKDPGDLSIIHAKRLFPHIDFTPTARSKKDHDGLTDASLIAVYASRKK